jgi:hypothetical protein
LAPAIGVTLALGIVTGAVVSSFSHALFPDTAQVNKPPPADTSRETRKWAAMRATLIVMPAFVLALTNPAFYLPTVMKAVALGQQAGSAGARSSGRYLVGSTLMGAALAAAVWCGLSLRANIWMLMLWMMAAALWVGVRLFGVKASAWPPSVWRDALVTMLILLGPAIEDSAAGKDVLTASAIRVSLFVGVALYAWAALWVLERWRGSPGGAPC